MFSAPNLKFKKYHQEDLKQLPKKEKNIICHPGVYALKVLEPAQLTAKQIETARRVLVAHLRGIGRIWIRPFPNYPKTARVADTRMGKGAGTVKYWSKRLEPGMLILELSDIREDIAVTALLCTQKKLPFNTKIIKARNFKKNSLERQNILTHYN